jgi:hypothetical protein
VSDQSPPDPAAPASDNFVTMLAKMDTALSAHPWWKRRCDGTPLANDLPVRAAEVAMTALSAALAERDAEIERLRKAFLEVIRVGNHCTECICVEAGNCVCLKEYEEALNAR